MSTDAAGGAVGGSHEIVDKWRRFIERYYHADEDSEFIKLAKGFPRHRESIRFEFSDLLQFDVDMADDWLENPERMEEYAQEALGQIAKPFQPDADLSDAHVRVGDLHDAEIHDVGGLYKEDVGSYVGIKGQVTRIQQPKSRLIKAAFECSRCGTMNYTTGEHEPHECEGCERQGPFHLNTSQSTERIQQWIRLQRPPEKTEGVEATIDVRLLGREVIQQTIRPGDRIVVNAILEESLENVDTNDPIEYDHIGKGIAIDIQDTSFEDIEITKDDEQAIRKIAEDNPFEQLTDSIAPQIHGHDREKEAIVLQLFGGVNKETGGGSQIRGNSHVAFVGDPGTAKTELIRHAHTVAPRSVYTGGNDTTAAGLTAAAVQDDFGDSAWNIKGGAMVQADGGLCCIDELDDMDEEDQKALNEALETQEVNVSKAGISATLPARTTTLITANPSYGRFNQYEPLADQIDLPAPLFSRFDLIFTFTDQPDKARDAEILNTMADTAKAAQQRASGEEVTVEDPSDPAIDEGLLRKYVAYARQNYVPVLTDDANAKITRTMADLRQANADSDDDSAVPVTFRKQEAFVRLSEASARARLSNDVEVQDVERARDLILACMRDVGVDPDTDEFDADVIETGTSQSQRQRIRRLRGIIEDQETEYEHGVPIDEVVTIADSDRERVEHEIEQLKQKGEIYEPTDGHLRTS